MSLAAKKKKIFTYIEPHSCMCGYMQLCLKTWEKNLSNHYEIVVLSSKNITAYIKDDILKYPFFLNAIPSFYYPLLVLQAIKENGGIFLSPYTIAVGSYLPMEVLLYKTDVVTFRSSAAFPSFLMANKNSNLIEKFLEFYDEKLNEKLWNKLLLGAEKDEAIVLDSENMAYYIEDSLFGVYNEYIYRKYYFSDISSSDEFFKTAQSIVALNPEWTPPRYNDMSADAFLKCDILLAKIFKEILN